MLVLSRQKDEKVIIGDGPDRIEVMLIEIRGDKIRLGIKAAPHIPVHREEIYLAIQRERGGQP